MADQGLNCLDPLAKNTVVISVFRNNVNDCVCVCILHPKSTKDVSVESTSTHFNLYFIEAS